MKSFLKRYEVKAGMHVECDSGFTCIPAYAMRTVQSDNGDLWIRCKHGRHYLEGQLNDAGEYVGLVKPEEDTGA